MRALEVALLDAIASRAPVRAPLGAEKMPIVDRLELAAAACDGQDAIVRRGSDGLWAEVAGGVAGVSFWYGPFGPDSELGRMIEGSRQQEMPALAAQTDLLQAYLRERDCACPGCGYNLRNLQSNRCPECAMELQLAVQLTEPRQGDLIAGLVGLTLGAGFSGTLLLIGLVLGLLDGRFGPAGFFAATQIGTAAEGLAIGLWIRHWNAIRRMGPGNRKWMVFYCWLLSACNVTAFMMLTR